ncbi:MAG TPA: class I SAM-dependent methyltransferase [Bryobacteraceae bacterium]|nr:class I SAM-dependent methyltransferase [Bryobacteraceae bacterium]
MDSANQARKTSGREPLEQWMKEYDEKTTGYFEFDRQDVLPYLPLTADRICEIGCGTGKTLAGIKRKYQASLAIGFDIHEQSIATARTRLDRAEVIDIEAIDLPEYVHDVDVFLCLDVLEHLRDPWSVIKALHARLRRGGCIVASIPNVRHYSVSFGLLFAGQWDLKDAGLLDRTHLRFFVRKTAIELMSSSGLTVDAVGVNYRRRRDRVMTMITAGVFQDVFALQYVIRATRV